MSSQPETIVITGASGGVGRAAARKFAADGARVALLARGRKGLEAAAREVEHAGGEALVLPVDVSDPDQLEAAAASVEDALGPIDVWVNDAMVTLYAEFLDIEPAEFKRSTEVSYLGMVWGTRAALTRMLPRDRGTIVQVGSALAYRAIPLQAPYCAAKHAIRGFTDSLRTELLHQGSNVHVTMVQMPALNTPQFDWARNKMGRRARPLGTIFQPEVAAQAIVHASHARRREIYVGGSTLATILGNKLMPGVFDRLMARLAYDGQLSNELAPPELAGNLFTPQKGDYGAHGRFDAEASGGSLELRLSRQRGLAVAGAACLAGFLAVLLAAPKSAARTPRLR
jgi:NAD(P)-dependent dehydrogenase (short-subunit alcohol dehydrogenase family)